MLYIMRPLVLVDSTAPMNTMLSDLDVPLRLFESLHLFLEAFS